MRISTRHKIWAKIIGLPVILLLLLASVLYYTVAFRLKQTIQLIVNKESNSVYSFDASDINVSLKERHIFIRNASFICKDTARNTPHYDVQVPGMYLAIGSWRELLIKRKLIIDSLSISLPHLKVHEHTQQKAKQVAFHASNIFEVLQKTSERLQIRSFSLQNAAFDYGNIHHPYPFKSNRISLFIKNFSKNNEAGGNFLSSEDVDLSIREQQWQLPDGLHEIGFTRMHFSGASQLFEVDSFVFKGIDKNKHAYMIKADKVFFNSRKLADFYNKEELVIDTLILHRPVITMERSASGKSDSASHSPLTDSFKDIFRLINFKFIDIREGGVALKYEGDEQPSFVSGKTNIRIYNFLLTEHSTNISVDSLSLQQKNLSFTTRDSLFRLTVEEFALQQNNMILKAVVYAPTEINKNSKVFTFRSALAKLSDVDLEDLMTRRLTATAAEVYKPELAFKTVLHKKTLSQKQKQKDKFYTTLHGLSELVNVQQFRVVDGNLQFESAGAEPVQLRAENINLLVLLNKLFRSDSLIDVKRSLPLVAVSTAFLHSPKLKLSVSDFRFEGGVRHNRAGRFHLQLSNGTLLNGKNLSWVIFDWDKYQNEKKIEVNTMRIGEIAIDIPTKTGGQQSSPKDLPLLHIDRLDIDKLAFRQSGHDKEMNLQGGNICMDTIQTVQQAITWRKAEGVFRNLLFRQPGWKAQIESADFNTQSMSTLQNVSFTKKQAAAEIEVTIPLAKIFLPVHTSKPEALRADTLAIHTPAIFVRRYAGTAMPAKKPSNIPFSFSIENLDVFDAHVDYSHAGNDSMSVNTTFSLHSRRLQQQSQNPGELLSWDKLAFVLKNSQLKRHTLSAELDQANVNITNGSLIKEEQHISLNGRLAAGWRNANLRLQKNDSTLLGVTSLTGQLNEQIFTLGIKDKKAWQRWLPPLNIHDGNFVYRNGRSDITANGIRYNGQTQNLQLDSFQFRPTLDADTLFKHTGWQTSYTALSSGLIELKQLQLPFGNDSLFKAGELVINNLTLTTKRDKRYPFKHGIEKPMLAQAINKIPVAFDINKVILREGKINVHEITEKSHQEAIVPLHRVNAVATHIRNRNNHADSLQLEANLQLYSTRARYFRYQEAYGDSLASFALQVQVSPIRLPEFTDLTVPFANVSVTKGRADTLYATWYGNKYAAAGKMNFYYDDLKIKMLSRKDSSKPGFIGWVGNFIANNVVLHRSNSKSVFIFYVRDPEKSVFNYWVKTKLNGLVGSAAILQRKKHYRLYKKNKVKYALPDISR